MAAPFNVVPVSTHSFMRLEGMKFLVYGRPDSGKTYLVRSLPKPLILASEKGLISLQNADIPYILCDTIERVTALTAWLTQNNCANIQAYDSIVLDSISFLSHQILSECKSRVSYKDPRKYFGDMADVVMPLIECLVNLPKHIYITAWQGENYHPITGQVIGYEPQTAGKRIQDYLSHFFDQTMHLAWHNVEQAAEDGTKTQVRMSFLQTGDAGNGVFARDRTNALELFEPADLSNIINKLYAAQQKGTNT